jgi:hypothetical protein
MGTQKKGLNFVVCLLIAGLAAGSFMSCTDFFTSTWAEWARRDATKMAPKVTAANIRDLIDQAQGNPDLSLDLLKKIEEALKDPKLTPAERSILRAAALEAAVNASGIASSLLNGVGDLLAAMGSGDAGSATGILSTLVGGMTNLEETSSALNAIFGGMDPESDEFQGFVDESDVEGLALSSLVLIAAEANKANKDIEEYITKFNPNDPPDNLTLVVKLADATAGKMGAGSPLGGLQGGLTSSSPEDEDE